MNARFLPRLVPILALLAAPAAAQPRVLYHGRSVPVAALPEAVPEKTREMVALWAPLLERLKLRAHLAADGSFLLATARRIRGAATLGRLAERVTAHLGKALGGLRRARPYTVMALREQREVAAVVDHLAPKYPYLRDWAPGARKAPGFNLYEPLVYVVLDDPHPKHEFRLRNQLVHQQTLLVLHAEIGRLPFWLREGIAWTVEEDLTRGIWAFNTREGFVGRAEHTGWRAAAARLAAKLGDLRLVLRNREERFERDAALLSYGVARHLEHLGPKTFRAALEALAAAWRKKSKDGERPEVALDGDEQMAALRDALGTDFEAEALAFLAGRRAPRKPRSPRHRKEAPR